MEVKEYNAIMEGLLDTEKEFAPYIIDTDQYQVNGLLIDVFYIEGSQKEYTVMLEPMLSNDMLGLFDLSVFDDGREVNSLSVNYNDVYKCWLITLEDFLVNSGVVLAYA